MKRTLKLVVNWFAFGLLSVEIESKEIVELNILKERNMFVAEHFLYDIIKEYGKHLVSIGVGTWYPQACRSLQLKHYVYSHCEKSLIGRTIQYIKYDIKEFDDYYPCRKKNCKLKHVKQWLVCIL